MIAKRLFAGIAGAILAMSNLSSSPADPPQDKKFSYPDAPRDSTVDTYHGTKVPDPFRPLEDPDSDATRAWVEAENKITFGYLETIPARDAIAKRITELWDYEKIGMPSKEGNRYAFSRNSGLQNQSVLYTTKSLGAEPKVLIDPNGLTKDGTVALSGASFSQDGNLFAYGLASAGSDWQEWRVRDVETGKDRDDLLKWIKFSGASWTEDGEGFYYGRYPEPEQGADLKGANFFQKLYYHELGTPQSDDVLIYETPDQKTWQFHGHATDDGKYLVITVSKGTDDKYRVLFKDLEADPKAEPTLLVDNFDNEWSFIDNDGPTFFFKTDRDAPKGKVVAHDVGSGKPLAEAATIIPETDDTLQGINLVGDRFFASYLHDAKTEVKIHDLAGKQVGEVKFPGIGTAGGFGGKKDDKETFYSFTTFTAPPTVYRYDIATGESTLFKRPEVAFNPDDFTTEQVFFASKDGTKVPMFVSYKKGLKRDGGNPTLLYGYGGFNISLTPSFSPANIVWMEMGGVYAVPNLRGGGEYGEKWHKAGTKLTKQNVFDDFIAAAEWLIDNKITSTPKLAISGGSNGGLLVGACLTQRPDLYGAALPAVGVLDMLRFHTFTIGHAWVDDYGSSDDSEQFGALFKYSPLHNVKPDTCYPPTLITTADHDDRVVPAHSFKFAATLQAAQSCDNPVLIRIETKAGHGAGKPTAKIIEEAADKFAFLVKSLGMEGVK